MKRLQYDPVTKKMVETEVKAGTKVPGAADATTYIVKGDELTALLGFAKEDSIDLTSDKRARGRAVNSYVEVAIDEFIKGRKARVAKASVK